MPHFKTNVLINLLNKSQNQGHVFEYFSFIVYSENERKVAVKKCSGKRQFCVASFTKFFLDLTLIL